MLKKIYKQAAELHRTVVLAEGGDERTLSAAEIALKEGWGNLIILGKENEIRLRLSDLKGYVAIDPERDERRKEFSEKYYALRSHKGVTREEAECSMKNELYFAAMLVREGYAHGALAGAVNTTGNVLKAGLRVIGPMEGVKTVSSFFIMITDKKSFGEDGVLFFADCAVNLEPTSEALADIALTTAQNFKTFVKSTPRVAFLSYSTKGSGSGAAVDKVRQAAEILKSKAPNILSDGELQLDAALVAEAADRKAPKSPVAGRANVLVFPDLNSANIGYKLAERLAGVKSVGPVIQGFAKPFNDLSRGAGFMDIADMIAITAVE
ncbi:MAG: phosphate acetyltransferase [Deferribacteraceae bacterium]|nr:phosphate acetyltransferase [Deferribacteraceae bacterium]